MREDKSRDNDVSEDIYVKNESVNESQKLPKLEKVSSKEIAGDDVSPESEKKVVSKKVDTNNDKGSSENKRNLRDTINREEASDNSNESNENEVDNTQDEVYDESEDGNSGELPAIPIDEESPNEMMGENEGDPQDPHRSNPEENDEENEADEDNEENEDNEVNEEDKDDSELDNIDEDNDSKENLDDGAEGIVNNERGRLLPKRGDESNKVSDKEGKDSSPLKDSNDGGDGGDNLADAASGAEVLKDKVLSKAPNPLKDNKAVEVMNSVRNKSIVAGKVLAAIGNMLINPFFWGAIGLFVIIAILLSTTEVIGKNDFNDICDSEGFGGVNISSDADDFTRQSAIASWLVSTPFETNGGQPMNREQASAIMGNFIHESSGANPKAIQGDRNMTEWQTCDNDCILSWGGTGKAIGIAQWMGDRRMNLASLAKSEGKQWYDLDVQLKLLQQELDGTSEADNGYRKGVMQRNGWNDTQTLEDYTYIFQRKFEGAMEARDSAAHQKREEYAIKFNSKFSGHGGASSGLSTNCVGGGMMNIDTSNVAALAIQSAWPTRDQGKFAPGCGGNVGCGKSQAKPEYLEIRKIAVDNTGGGGVSELYASCDMFIATAIRASGLDPDFPWTSSGTQANYMRNSPDWQEISCQNRQPGDVLWFEGHVMMYVGDVNGTDSIASASLGDRVGTISSTSCIGSKFDADGGVAQGWRKVN